MHDTPSAALQEDRGNLRIKVYCGVSNDTVSFILENEGDFDLWLEKLHEAKEKASAPSPHHSVLVGKPMCTTPNTVLPREKGVRAFL